jgi:hypothetical protein
MNIRIYHLKNGCEIIAEVTNKSNDVVTLTNPCYINEDEMGMKLQYALMLSSESAMCISENDVLFSYAPKDIMVKYYAKVNEYTTRITQTAIKRQITEAIEVISAHIESNSDIEDNQFQVVSIDSSRLH